MMIFYNLTSLILGLVSWAIAIAALARRKNYSFPSFTACAISLLLQLLEIRRRVDIGDISAIYDTIGAVCLAAGVLVTVAVALNLIAVLRKRK